MKYLIALATVIALSGSAYAMRCYTTTTSYNGKLITCTTCCDQHGNCTQNCF